MSHHEVLWTENPFQLLDFLLIGEKNVTLVKVVNAIARIGMLVAGIMYMRGNTRWWIWGLAILFVSIGFYYTSIYTQCDTGYVRGSLNGTVIEGFNFVEPKKTNDYEPAGIRDTRTIPANHTNYEVRRTTVPYRHPIYEEGQNNINTLSDAISYEHEQRIDDMNQVYSSQVDDYVDHLDRQLVREDFAEMYFAPYEVYSRDAVYASLEPLIH